MAAVCSGSLVGGLVRRRSISILAGIPPKRYWHGVAQDRDGLARVCGLVTLQAAGMGSQSCRDLRLDLDGSSVPKMAILMFSTAPRASRGL